MHAFIPILATFTLFAHSVEGTGTRFAASPCYAVITAITPDSTTGHVRRVVSSGVRRFGNSERLAAPSCAVANPARLAEIKRLVTAELAGDASGSQWITLETTDSAAAGDHLRRLAQVLERASAFVVIRLQSDTDLVSGHVAR